MNGYIDCSGNAFMNGLVPSTGEIGKERKAVFFLFSPKKVENHYKRPLAYNFNHELIYSFLETLNDPVNIANKKAIREISKTNASQRSALPSSKGIDMNFSAYSDSWTGVLIVFNDKSFFDNDLLDYRNELNNRVIYIGIFNQEPVNPLTLYATAPTLNPNTTFFITRKILFNKINQYSSKGLVSKDDLMCDIGVYRNNPSLMGNKKLYNLDPYDLLNNTALGVNDEIILKDLGGIEDNEIELRGISRINNMISSPKVHMTRLFDGIAQGVEFQKYQKDENEFDFSSFDTINTLRENTSQILENDTINYVDQIGLVSNNTYNLSEIISAYNPTIQTIVSENPKADIIPQNITSPNNVFSSLITSCIPSYMSRSGISALSFIYNSFHGALQVMQLEAFDTQLQDDLLRRWKTFYRIFKFELEPVIKASVGEFDLSINSSVNGSTYVHLNLLDFSPLPDNLVYEENGLLGGLTTSTIGDQSTMYNNASQLGGLIKTVTEQLDKDCF